MSRRSIDPLISLATEPITPEQSGVRPIPERRWRRTLLRSLSLLLPVALALALVVWPT